MSNDDLEKEIFELLDKRSELLPILKEITSGAQNGVRMKISNLLVKYENKVDSK
ncbi:MAG: hypothetical protein GPJ52_00135 [Candidatus Heimdallarchaeota archaeon]|nr:hypothetical protein [Candidatus Heimdallarchaeota archaeon]